MNRDVVLNLRIDSDVKESVDEYSSEMGISASEFIRNAIDYYLEEKPFELPTEEEIRDMTWEELCEIIDEFELEIDSAEYDNSGFFSSPDENDVADLCEAVLDMFGYTVEVSDDE